MKTGMRLLIIVRIAKENIDVNEKKVVFDGKKHALLSSITINLCAESYRLVLHLIRLIGAGCQRGGSTCPTPNVQCPTEGSLRVRTKNCHASVLSRNTIHGISPIISR